ncbi:MAG: hypothetical protein V4620_00965 [Bacteroidota bacterium]
MKLIVNQAKINTNELPSLASDNKMTVVIIVIAIIFTLITAFLVFLDLRLRKIEAKNK